MAKLEHHNRCAGTEPWCCDVGPQPLGWPEAQSWRFQFFGVHDTALVSPFSTAVPTRMFKAVSENSGSRWRAGGATGALSLSPSLNHLGATNHLAGLPHHHQEKWKTTEPLTTSRKGSSVPLHSQTRPSTLTFLGIPWPRKLDRALPARALVPGSAEPPYRCQGP